MVPTYETNPTAIPIYRTNTTSIKSPSSETLKEVCHHVSSRCSLNTNSLDHEFAVSPEASIGHEPAVPNDGHIEHLPLPPTVSPDTNPSTRQTRSTTPASTTQRAETRMTVETSPREALVASPVGSRPHRAAKQNALATSNQRGDALKALPLPKILQLETLHCPSHGELRAQPSIEEASL